MKVTEFLDWLGEFRANFAHGCGTTATIDPFGNIVVNGKIEIVVNPNDGQIAIICVPDRSRCLIRNAQNLSGREAAERTLEAMKKL